jgi:hypothetical protein
MANTNGTTSNATSSHTSSSSGGTATNTNSSTHSCGQGTNHHQGGQQQAPRVDKPKFEGLCEGLKGHIYDCNSPKHVEHFKKMTEVITEYINHEYNHGSYLCAAIVKEEDKPMQPKKPADLTSMATKTDKEIWKQEVAIFIKTKAMIESHVCSLFSLVLGQCTDAMKAKLEALDNWDTMVTEMNGLDLLLQVKTITFQFESTQYELHALIDAKHHFWSFNQSQFDNQEYHQLFQSHVQVITHCGRTLGYEVGALE